MLAAADRAPYGTTKEELADRYGRGPRPIRRRVFWVTVATAAILSVAGLSWLTVSNSLDDVGYDETGFELVDVGAGHLPTVEAPEAVVPLLAAFLDG